MNIQFELWKNSNGKSYGAEFIKDQGDERAGEIEAHLISLQEHTFLELVQSGNIKKIKGTLYEIRMRINKTNYRLLFEQRGKISWIVEVFIKKTNKVPIKHIATAEKRIKEILYTL
jgi:phage-related protein